MANVNFDQISREDFSMQGARRRIGRSSWGIAPGVIELTKLDGVKFRIHNTQIAYAIEQADHTILWLGGLVEIKIKETSADIQALMRALPKVAA